MTKSKKSRRDDDEIPASEFDPDVGEDAADPLDLAAPTLADAYTVDDLRRDRKRELLSFERLPHRAGWGSTLDRLIGGGIGAGEMLVLGAASAGAGKTGFVMQAVDGLAARSANLIRERVPGVLTPILLLSELSPGALTARTLARRTGVRAGIFRAGDRASTALGIDEAEVDAAFAEAERVLADDLGDARKLMRVVVRDRSGSSIIEHVRMLADGWRERVRRVHERDVVPVVVVDPVHRLQDYAVGETEALNEVVDALHSVAVADGLIVLATSDTNTTSARGRVEGGRREAAAAVFRGTYLLPHIVDFALVARRYALQPDVDGAHRDVFAVFAYKNRSGIELPYARAGALFRWTPVTMQFEPWCNIGRKLVGRAAGEAGSGAKREQEALLEIDKLERFGKTATGLKLIVNPHEKRDEDEDEDPYRGIV